MQCWTCFPETETENGKTTVKLGNLGKLDGGLMEQAKELPQAFEEIVPKGRADVMQIEDVLKIKGICLCMCRV